MLISLVNVGENASTLRPLCIVKQIFSSPVTFVRVCELHHHQITTLHKLLVLIKISAHWDFAYTTQSIGTDEIKLDPTIHVNQCLVLDAFVGTSLYFTNYLTLSPDCV